VQILDFTKSGDALVVPDLVEIQRKSYADFLQAEVPPRERKNQGLERLLRETFPIAGPAGGATVEYLYYELGEPAYTELECRRLGLTYAYPLYLRLRCVSGQEAVEEDVYVGDIPVMIGGGEFIINGAERLIVAQIQRSPGVDFSEDLDSTGRKVYSCRIVPERGTWIELSVGRKDVLYVRLGQGGRMPATWLLRAMFPDHSSDADILALFYESETVNLAHLQKEEQVVGRYLAGEIVDGDTGEVLARAGARLTREQVEMFRASGMTELALLKDVEDPLIINTLAEDNTGSEEEAVQRIYARLRPGVPRSPERAREFLRERFSNPRRYNLGRVGRFRINRKLGLDVPESETTLRNVDVLAAIKYLFKLRQGQGTADDIDHLGNRVLRLIGNLAEEGLREGLLRFRRSVREHLESWAGEHVPPPREVAGSKSLAAALDSFFGRGELSQVVDQTNPLSQLQHERRISALGPGGLNRKRAGFEVRDVHVSHYGRICPIETPEGPNIGLISSLALYAKVDEYGFITTPYRKVVGGRPTREIVYLRADQEEGSRLAPALTPSRDTKELMARCNGEFVEVAREAIDYVDVSPKQMVGVSASLIPFLEHNDANRALMGSNMQRQAVPLLQPELPIVATGMERVVAQNSSMVVRAVEDGVVTSVDGSRIVVGKREYPLRKFFRLNEKTCLNQRPLVRRGDKVKCGQIIADGAATRDGELSLGRNVLVAFMCWDGYNFEDAIVVSESLVREDKFTSIHIEELEVQLRETRLGREEFTNDIPNVSESARAHLDERGFVRIGTKVKPGDILVGKVSPKSKSELTPEEKLVRAIFGRAGEDVKDESLKVPPGSGGVVVDVAHFVRKSHLTEKERRECEKKAQQIAAEHDAQIAALFREMLNKLGEVTPAPDAKFQPPSCRTNRDAAKLAETYVPDFNVFHPNARRGAERIFYAYRDAIRKVRANRDREVRRMRVGDELPSGVLEMVKVYIATKRQLSVGDKMAGRHGNKGVIARIVPQEDMPFLADGTPVEIVLNPLGVPSRMNIGQILETHLGWAAKVLGFRVISPVFDGATEDEIHALLAKAGLPEDGKAQLYDGRTGEPFDQRTTVGWLYMMKLDHLVEDKVHARATGPYSLITQQPLGGKARMGGQRLGEMEVWALEAYGAAYTLQEMVTVKSDDVDGRARIYESIVKGRNILEAGRPLSFDVLCSEIRGLALNIEVRSGPPSATAVLAGAETGK